MFAPVSRMETIRMILSTAIQQKWSIHQMDVKSSAFLNGILQEEVYVEQTPGFIRKGSENSVIVLRKPYTD